MSICAGVVVAVAFKQVDCTPDVETCAESDNKGLKNGYCAVEKCGFTEWSNPASPGCEWRAGLGYLYA